MDNQVEQPETYKTYFISDTLIVFLESKSILREDVMQ